MPGGIKGPGRVSGSEALCQGKGAKARRVHHSRGPQRQGLAGARPEQHKPPRLRLQAHHRCVINQFGASGGRIAGQGLQEPVAVDNTRLRGPERRGARERRRPALELRAGKAGQARNPKARAPVPQGFQRPFPRGVGGHHELAEFPMPHAPGCAVGIQQFPATAAQRRLQAILGIVETGVDHFRGAAGNALPKGWLGFEQEDRLPGLGQGAGAGQTHHAAPKDHRAVVFDHELPCTARPAAAKSAPASPPATQGVRAKSRRPACCRRKASNTVAGAAPGALSACP